MNQFVATVNEILYNDSLALVYFHFMESELVMMSLDMQGSLEKGQKVTLGVKSTAIVLCGMKEKKCTFSNSIPVFVEKIFSSKLLSRVLLRTGETMFESITPKRDLQKSGIIEGDKIFAAFLASDLFIIGNENV